MSEEILPPGELPLAESSIDELLGGEIPQDSLTESAAPELPETVGTLNREGSDEGGGTLRRDVPISALVHLLGLPTSSELSVIESKIDNLTAKLSGLHSKFDRLSQQVGTLANEFYIDRIDFQISEIRTLMKRVFPHVVKDSDFQSGPIKEKRSSSSKQSSEDSDS